GQERLRREGMAEDRQGEVPQDQRRTPHRGTRQTGRRGEVSTRAEPDSPWPDRGFGIGLRAEHYEDVLAGDVRTDWFEAISENYMDTGGRPLHVLETVRRDRPVALHGVAL